MDQQISEHSLMIVGRRELTVRDYAKQEQVSEITVRRWISKGAVPVRRTPGGGVRVIIRNHP